MTQTTYPISKIRSGEVAVLLTDIEQHVKLCEIVDGKNNYIPNYSENKYHGRVFGYCIEPLENHELFNRTLIDFQQIDWEEGNEETVEEASIKHCNTIDEFPRLENPMFSFKEGAKWQKEQSDKELSNLKAENERLKEENEELRCDMKELKEASLNLAINTANDLGKLKKPESSQNQELSLKQRMAWEYISQNEIPKAGFSFVYEIVDNFLNYKGEDDEKI